MNDVNFININVGNALQWDNWATLEVTLKKQFFSKTNSLFFIISDNKDTIIISSQEKYIGKIAKVVERVTKTGGVVSMYDERWNARCVKDEEIEVGTEVKIIKNESLILFVEKNQ